MWSSIGLPDNASVVNPDLLLNFSLCHQTPLALDDSGFTTDSEKNQVVEDILEGIEPRSNPKPCEP